MSIFNRRRKRKNAPVDAAAEIERERIKQVPLTEETGPPDLSGVPRGAPPGVKAFMVLLALILTVGLGLLTWQAIRAKRAKDTDEPAKQTALADQVRNMLPSLELPKPEKPPEEVKDVRDDPAPHGDLLSRQIDLKAPRDILSEEDDVTKRRLSSGLTSDKPEDDKDSSTQADKRDAARDAGRDADSGPMAEAVQASRLARATASVLPDRDYLITQGAMIDCGQQTKLVSAQAGQVTCYSTREVRSASGRVVLIDPGTKFVGYQRGILGQGVPRIPVVWSRMETPEGVVIHLDSPGTGPLGEAGLDGFIDTHFAERFGGAIMVSLIDDFGDWASNRGGGSNNNGLRLDGTSDAATDAVTTVLENTINIPPTLYRNQGGRVAIYVARDLDFSSVYALKSKP